ncbi:HIRAN domain protein [Prevotella disiens FB035-09AN]|uniref:HIRAN domain protein n=1 Tax=Prevotella disiens FB035-09AN TaxID=866771 RepID=E1KNX1_9BACT|nr:HIRAN domain-containing protein [Prevotella disiens]EFL46775.1 HIRAN domain protein [Prevotella disiens FB035-09AN]
MKQFIKIFGVFFVCQISINLIILLFLVLIHQEHNKVLLNVLPFCTFLVSIILTYFIAYRWKRFRFIKKTDINAIKFTVAGISYRKYEEVERAEILEKGEIVYLKREPTNIHDENAIKIFTKDHVFIGYVPKKVNVNIPNHVTTGYVVDVILTSTYPCVSIMCKWLYYVSDEEE